jgi:uncharacterized membrane protein (GlpM family)
LSPIDTADLAAFVFRLLATSGVVLGITYAVGRLGPTAGGMLAGLPIVVGPGLVFLAADESPAFVAETATFALLSLCATQAFMLSYLAAARRFSVAPALLLATLAWFVSAAVLADLATGPWFALALFATAAVTSRFIGKRLRVPNLTVRSRDTLTALILRAGLAGILVGVITGASSWLGPQYSGLLIAYPVGSTVIAASIHLRYGASKVVDTLYAIALGTISIAAFCFIVALTAERLGSVIALTLGFAASFLLTIVLLIRARFGGR